MNNTWEHCLKRYNYLSLTIEELQLWLASAYYHDEPDFFTRVLERLVQVIFDEMIEISRYYLAQNDPANQALDRKELLARMEEDLGVIRPDLAKKLAGEYINMRNDLVHNPEQVDAQDVIRFANTLVKDARLFVDGFSRLALCPCCGKMWTYSRTPSVGQQATCDACGTRLIAVSVAPLQMKPEGEGAVAAPHATEVPPEVISLPESLPANREGPVDVIEAPEPPEEQIAPVLEEPGEPDQELPKDDVISTAGDILEIAETGTGLVEIPFESPVMPPEPARFSEPWEEVFRQALGDYEGKEGTRPNYPLALSGFRAAAEHGCPYAYRNLGVMSRLGQGGPKDGKKARGYFNKGLSKGDKRCLAELAILLFEEGEVEKSRGQWKSYFMSAPYIDNQSYLEPSIDRLHYAAIYIDQVLEQGAEIPLWDRLAPLQAELVKYYQGLIQADIARKQRAAAGIRQRKLAVLQHWIAQSSRGTGVGS